MTNIKTFKDDFLLGIQPGDVLIIEQYAHIYEYARLLDLIYDENSKEAIVKGVRVQMLENDETKTFSVFLIEPLTINTLTLQKFGFDNFEKDTIYATNGQFSLRLNDGPERIYVSTKSSPCCWIYKAEDNFDRDEEHAIPVKFMYDIQHEFEKYCNRKLDLSQYYVPNNAYDQKKKDYDDFIKQQIRSVLSKNDIYAGSELGSRILKEMSEEYAD